MGEMALLGALAATSATASVAGTALSISSANTAQKTAGQQAREVQANNAKVVRDTQVQAAEAAAYAEQDRAAAYEGANRDANSQLKQYEEERKAQTLEASQQIALQQRAMVQALSSAAAVRGGSGLDVYSQTGQAIMAETLREGAADLDTLKANWGRNSKALDTGEAAVVQNARNLRDQADRNTRNALTQARNSVTAARNGATASNFQATSNAQNVSNQAAATKAQAITSGVRGLAQSGGQAYSYFSRA